MKEILLSQGKVALVDDEDYNKVIGHKYKWVTQPHRNTYYAISFKSTRMHRLIMDAKVNEQIDHIDGNGLNNCRSNLRIVNGSQQMMNRGKFKAKSSKYKGVYYFRVGNNWQAHVRKDRHKIHLGYFKTEEEAALAYDIAAQELFGDYAKLNFTWEART